MAAAWVVDAGTKQFVAANDEAIALFGLDPSTLADTSLADVHPPEEYAAAVEWMARDGGFETLTRTWRGVRLDGETVRVVASLVVADFRGRPSALFVAETSHDEVLEAMRRMLTHEMRSPLLAIEWFSGKLDSPDAERIRQAAQRLKLQVEGMAALLRVARQPLAIEPVDVSALCRQIAGSRPGVAIAEGVTCAADVALLTEALEQLFDNAFKFTAGQPHPRIELTREGEGAFAIADNGAGFDMAHAEPLFQPFRRLHTDEEFPGLGIGLAIVHRIVTRHGGRIQAAAVKGQGARFLVVLPAPAG